MTHFSFSEHHDRIHESLTAMAQIYGEDASILHIDYSMWSLTFAHRHTKTAFSHWFHQHPLHQHPDYW